jgi:hypothetical protein
MTSPQTVYWPSRKVASSRQMKNWLLALLGSEVRAIEHGAAGVRLFRELGFQVGLLGARGAGAGRIAALGHEARDDAVEDDAVVEAFLGQLGDAGDVAGGQVRRSLMTTSRSTRRRCRGSR